MSKLTFENVSRYYGDTCAVADLNLTVSDGEFLTLLGPSGCGKTTSLRMVSGFVEPTSGRIFIGDTDITGVLPEKRSIGLVFQNYALFPHMTVGENVTFGLKMAKVGKAEQKTRLKEALKLVQLEGLVERMPRELSGGQQQRVALARSLILRPNVLLLDEPFGALDKQLRDYMRVELRALQIELGITTIFVTHDQDEAMSMSDRICIMNHGHVNQIGTPEEVYRTPANKFIAEFMGQSNILPASVVKSGGKTVTIQVAGATLEIDAPSHMDSKQPEVLIRPERISLQPPKGTGSKAKVIDKQYFGSLIEYTVESQDGSTLSVAAATNKSNHEPSEGDMVMLDIDASAVFVLPQCEAENQS